MAINKVTYGGKTLVDLTSDTVTADKLASGVTAHDKAGNKITGTMAMNGAISKTLDTSTKSYSVPKGYTDGGTVNIVTETKSVTPTKSTQSITPSSGKVLEKVTVNPIPDNYVDASTVATNVKIYDLTLSGGSGWVLLTKLDDIVLQHINDTSMVASFVCTDPYVYSFYAARFCIATNNQQGTHSGRAIYALTSRQPAEATMHYQASPYPANYTGTTDSLGSYSTFRFANNSYYLRPADGYVAAGHYRLTFVW